MYATCGDNVRFIHVQTCVNTYVRICITFVKKGDSQHSGGNAFGEYSDFVSVGCLSGLLQNANLNSFVRQDLQPADV